MGSSDFREVGRPVRKDERGLIQPLFNPAYAGNVAYVNVLVLSQKVLNHKKKNQSFDLYIYIMGGDD